MFFLALRMAEFTLKPARVPDISKRFGMYVYHTRLYMIISRCSNTSGQQGFVCRDAPDPKASCHTLSPLATPRLVSMYASTYLQHGSSQTGLLLLNVVAHGVTASEKMSQGLQLYPWEATATFSRLIP